MTDSRAPLLSAVVGFVLRHRGVIISLATLVAIYGLFSLRATPYDVFPEFAPPKVVVQTEAPGLAPEQVETLVTQPIENAVNGVQGVDSLRSSSIQGLSVVMINFKPGAGIYRDRQQVAERLAALSGDLPRGVKPPRLTPLTSATSVVLMLGLTSSHKSLMALRTVADWTVKPRLLAVPGVADVMVFGGGVKQLQVQIDPHKLARYDLSLQDVTRAVRRATGVQGAGFIDTPNQRVVLQTYGQAIDAEQLARAPLVRGGGEPLDIPLGKLATVKAAPAPAVGAALIQGRPGVELMVTGQYGANTLNVSGRVTRALQDLRPALAAQGVTLHPALFKPANFIRTALHNMESALYLGAVLVAVVLVLFLFNLRAAAISCIAIPLSLLAAVIVMERLGMSLNTMTLGGLAIAIGLLVDDAVITVENIFRRLHENRGLTVPRPNTRVILSAALEVRSAVVYATLVVALVFVPVLALPGLVGRLFGPLALAYVLATFASLVVALTVTPALASLFLAERALHRPRAVQWLLARYCALLGWMSGRFGLLVVIVLVIAAAGVAAIPFFGGEFLPTLKEGHYIVHMAAVPGTSITESLRIGARVTRALRRLPEVRSVVQQVGRAPLADDTWGTHYSEVNVDLKPTSGESADAIENHIRSALAPFPGLHFTINTFLTERIEEILSGYTAPVVVNIFGNNLNVLDHQAQWVAAALRKVPGAVDVQVQAPPGMPQLDIRLRRDRLARWGLEPGQVLAAIHTAYQGEVTGQVYDGNRVFDVAVILAPSLRRSVNAVGDLPLRTPAGNRVQLRKVADITLGSGRYSIDHDGARRVQAVTCNIRGHDLSTFVARARHRIARLAMPAGTYVQFSGAAAAQRRSVRALIVYSAIVGAGVILLLWLVLGRFRNLMLVLVNLPFALIGGVLAVFATGGWVSMGSLIGFVTLFGISLRNAIMMISHYQHLVAAEGMRWGWDAMVRGASERLLPILMTTVVTALGLLPLALGAGLPGREIEGPMAQVILGGLVSSMVLNLLLLPGLALRFGRFENDAGPDDAAEL